MYAKKQSYSCAGFSVLINRQVSMWSWILHRCLHKLPLLSLKVNGECFATKIEKRTESNLFKKAYKSVKSNSVVRD